MWRPASFSSFHPEISEAIRYAAMLGIDPSTTSARLVELYRTHIREIDAHLAPTLKREVVTTIEPRSKMAISA
jgi:hypothetical protein